MKQKYNYKQTHRHNFTLTTQSKQSLEILKMDYREVIQLLIESAKKNPFVDFQLHPTYETSLLDTLSNVKTLQDDLYYQLHTTHVPYDEVVCAFIIESLNEHGFLSYSEHEYCALLHIQPYRFQENLSLIQSFEPCGVACANARDAMLFQCHTQGNHTGVYLLTHHTQDIIHQNYKKIACAMHLSIPEVRACINSLRACNPNPCFAYEQTPVSLRLPEIDLVIQDQELLIQPINIGNYAIHEEYISAIHTHPELKTYLQEAMLLFETIHKRNATLLIIANELMQIQKGYFLYQDELNPCTLKDIATRLGMSTSTISRTLYKKYYRFKEECYPFKQLFVSSSMHGDSSDRIRKALARFIQQEDKQNPLSDQQIVIKLSSMDITTTRRTIAKYREQLGILSSAKRKKTV